MKTCTKCGQEFTLSKFKTEKRAKDSLTSACRNCINASKRQHYYDNKEKCNVSAKEYYLKHRDEILNYKSNWRTPWAKSLFCMETVLRR